MKPTAVLISDIHFTPATLALASASLQQALDKAFELKVPLILSGDTLDSKAVIRAECANRLIEILSKRPNHAEQVYVIVGNHDLVNEKGSEHSLNFLRPYCTVVQAPVHVPKIGAWLIPYFSDLEALQDFLARLKPGATIIGHQGVQGADMGHYVLDKTSLPVEAFSRVRFITGHYHRRQNLGTVSYIGNPYTLTFGEADHPEKGFQVLMDDGSLEFVSTNLRKHRVIEREWPLMFTALEVGAEDLAWVKIQGPKSEISSLSKDQVRRLIGLPHLNFKLDLIPTDAEQPTTKKPNQTSAEVLDELIDNSGETPQQKERLKALWRDLCA